MARDWLLPLASNNDRLYIQKITSFLEVAGNQYRNVYFLALRFRLPVLYQRGGGGGGDKLRVPPGSVLVMDQPPPDIRHPGVLVLVHAFPFPAYFPSEQELLIKCFQPNDVVCAAYQSRTLYLVSKSNPFLPLPDSRRTVAFKALVKLYASCVAHTIPFTLDVVAGLRHFSRAKDDLHSFHGWHRLVHQMCSQACLERYGHSPEACFGQQCHGILKRSLEHRDADPDFYTCHLTLSDEQPVGVACSIVQGKTCYVSSMIVSFTREHYLDNRGVACCGDFNCELATCRYWFPLYKDRQTWYSSGLEWYTRKPMTSKLGHLEGILDWLSMQTSEFYERVRADLLFVHWILVGEAYPRENPREKKKKKKMESKTIDIERSLKEALKEAL